MPITAAIYVRISQDREGAGLGVARQEKDCREIAERLGYVVVGVYTDNDVSAYSGKKRPAYERLLSDIETGQVKAVVTWHIDRLHRSTVELETYIRVAETIPTHTVKAGLLDLTTSTGRMMARITGAVARQESEHKSERQRRKADELASKGLPLGGGRPFGYEPGGMTLRESEAAELRAMVKKVLAGDSLGSIMRDLNERGVRTTREGQWGYTSLREILLRERNCGRMVHRGKLIGRAQWDPIISETDHDAVGAILANPARRTTTTSARKHLLSGLLRCGACGTAMKAGWVTSRGKRYNLYRCPQRGSGHVYRSKERVEAYVTERVLQQLSAVFVMPTGIDSAALETERDALKVRQEQMAAMFADGAVTAAQLAAFTSTARERLDVITEALSEVAASGALEGTYGLGQEDWDLLPLDRKRKIIDALMVITVEPVKHGPLSGTAGVAIKLRSDQTPGHATTAFGFTMPDTIASQVRAAAL